MPVSARQTEADGSVISFKTDHLGMNEWTLFFYVLFNPEPHKQNFIDLQWTPMEAEISKKHVKLQMSLCWAASRGEWKNRESFAWYIWGEMTLLCETYPFIVNIRWVTDTIPLIKSIIIIIPWLQSKNDSSCMKCAAFHKNIIAALSAYPYCISKWHQCSGRTSLPSRLSVKPDESRPLMSPLLYFCLTVRQ